MLCSVRASRFLSRRSARQEAERCPCVRHRLQSRAELGSGSGLPRSRLGFRSLLQLNSCVHRSSTWLTAVPISAGISAFLIPTLFHFYYTVGNPSYLTGLFKYITTHLKGDALDFSCSVVSFILSVFEVPRWAHLQA